MKRYFLIAAGLGIILTIVALLTINKQIYIDFANQALSRQLSGAGITVNFVPATLEDSLLKSKIKTISFQNPLLPNLEDISYEARGIFSTSLKPLFMVKGKISGGGLFDSTIKVNLISNTISGTVILENISAASIEPLERLGIATGTISAKLDNLDFIASNPGGSSSDFSIKLNQAGRPAGKSPAVPELFAGFIPEITDLNINISGVLKSSSGNNSQPPASHAILKAISIDSPLLKLTASGESLFDVNLGVCKDLSIKGNILFTSDGIEKLGNLMPLLGLRKEQVLNQENKFTVSGCSMKFSLT